MPLQLITSHYAASTLFGVEYYIIFLSWCIEISILEEQHVKVQFSLYIKYEQCHVVFALIYSQLITYCSLCFQISIMHGRQTTLQHCLYTHLYFTSLSNSLCECEREREGWLRIELDRNKIILVTKERQNKFCFKRSKSNGLKNLDSLLGLKINQAIWLNLNR